MSLLHLPQGNLKVAEDSYMTGRERNEKKKSEIQKAIHLKGKRKSAVNSIIHLGNRVARERISESPEGVRKKYTSNYQYSPCLPSTWISFNDLGLRIELHF